MSKSWSKTTRYLALILVLIAGIAFAVFASELNRPFGNFSPFSLAAQSGRHLFQQPYQTQTPMGSFDCLSCWPWQRL